jgi:hypothetical protein
MADPMFPQPMKRVVVGMGFLNKLAKKGRVGELRALKKILQVSGDRIGQAAETRSRKGHEPFARPFYHPPHPALPDRADGEVRPRPPFR